MCNIWPKFKLFYRNNTFYLSLIFDCNKEFKDNDKICYIQDKDGQESSDYTNQEESSDKKEDKDSNQEESDESQEDV